MKIMIFREELDLLKINRQKILEMKVWIKILKLTSQMISKSSK